MRRSKLILDRYRPLGEAGAGGFGTVQVAWDERIQRKVAIKTIQLTELDAVRAALPGANAVIGAAHPGGARPRAASPADKAAAAVTGAQESAVGASAGRWDGVLPWEDAEPSAAGAPDAPEAADALEAPATSDEIAACEASGVPRAPDIFEPIDAEALYADDLGPASLEDPAAEPIRSLAHLPGLDEARTAATLQDARIVTVYDFEVRDRTAYLIMEYVEGLTLTRLLRNYADYLTLDIVAAVFEAVAGALAVAHKAGVLHLDIKPDNIMINEKGQVKVTDFGLATLADAAGQGTAGGGTIGYMPLEQMRREHLDARTDEWSLAAVLYEMLAGENPFLAPNLAEAPAAIEDAELILPSLCWNDLDEQIDDVIFYALDPYRGERYASVKDFAEEACKFLGSSRRGRSQLAALVTRDLRGPVPEPSADLQDAQAAAPEDEEAHEAALAPGRAARTGEASAARAARSARRRRAARNAAAATASALLSPRAVSVAGRVFAVAASAFLGYLAATNIAFISAAATPIAPAALVVAAAVGAVALFKPSLGALLGYLLLSVALIVGGSPIAGATVAVASFAWWYFFGRLGVSEGNVGLSEPIAGALGAGPLAPLAAGASLRVASACATAAFACVVAVVLGACGTGLPIGWDALTNWQFSRADVDGRLFVMLRNPAVWCLVASWIASAAAQALVGTRATRGAELAGFALGVALLAAGAFAAVLFSPALGMGNLLVRLVLSILLPALVVLAGLVLYRPTE